MKLHPSWFHRLHFNLPEYLFQVNCHNFYMRVHFFLIVFQVLPKTRPWESPRSSRPLGLVHCCLVFMLGYSFTKIKAQERRYDKTGLPPPWHESFAGFRGAWWLMWKIHRNFSLELGWDEKCLLWTSPSFAWHFPSSFWGYSRKQPSLKVLGNNYIKQKHILPMHLYFQRFQV